MIRLTQETDLVPVLRMKKNNMKYRISEFVCDETVSRELDVKRLYKHYVRKAWQPICRQKYQAKTVDVELNLAESKDREEWVKVRLLFVRGNAGDTQAPAGKHDWAVFLTTDTALSSAEILELYALRWAIEIDQPCCLHKSVLRKSFYRFCDWFYPGTINSPQFT
jgi:hypothetical protein